MRGCWWSIASLWFQLHAEVRAILAALQTAPADATLYIITDSLSAMQAITHPCVSEGRRHRSGARALVSACRKLVLLRAVGALRLSLFALILGRLTGIPAVTRQLTSTLALTSGVLYHL